jgi:hypothetical protein
MIRRRSRSGGPRSQAALTTSPGVATAVVAIYAGAATPGVRQRGRRSPRDSTQGCGVQSIRRAAADVAPAWLVPGSVLRPQLMAALQPPVPIEGAAGEPRDHGSPSRSCRSPARPSAAAS